MTNKTISFYLCTLWLFASCNTYTTFYSRTYDKIPEKNVPTIHRLDLRNQNLTELPKTIDQIKDLRMIDLSSNPQLDLELALEKLSIHNSLEVLILDSLDIKTIPKSIKKFSNLKQISLVHNPNLRLDQVISQLSELPIEFLNLKDNQLTKLPENITSLKHLKDLNLSYNSITDSNTYIFLGRLPKLYSLWIDHNELKTIPKTIGKLAQIRFLYLDHNSLRELPDELIDMKKLWVVHVGYNKFTELPSVFARMKVLLMVHINNNDITEIPKIYETEKYALAGLLLDNNPLSNKEIERAKRIFKGFFLLSFEQKLYE
ncbi:leucine-rich repeat domain-containing protein [Aquimarina litoralis]|uniref:leucine-rich repeat domain-containing protein n=1 Tax=Aquimarina litoralis TaxID=584605 RepID=UPI001C580898|nr:hypothetical protein [Aquimarina litoralis]MBW1298387.1 hypothetical protein [Aquimarina litoralis]